MRIALIARSQRTRLRFIRFVAAFFELDGTVNQRGNKQDPAKEKCQKSCFERLKMAPRAC